MANIPVELLAAYAEIIKQAPEAEQASAHLLNFLLDAEAIAKAIEEAVTAAKQRAAS